MEDVENKESDGDEVMGLMELREASDDEYEDVCEVQEFIKNIDMITDDKKIKRELIKFKFFGHINIQAFIIKNKVVFIEINPRFGGASSLSIEYGLDSFYWLLIEILKIKNLKIMFNKKRNIKKQIKVESSIFV